MQLAETGFVVLRASRLEALLDPLLTLLETQQPADVLAPQSVIAAHAGMKHWLSAALARKRGPGGIVANLEIGLPSGWIDAQARHYLGASAIAVEAYRRDRLRWRIHECLGELDHPQIKSYLRGNDPARRRFQLADRLAQLYTQCLVYRPDWLMAWQNRRAAVAEAGFQPELWRRVRALVGMPHRAELLGELIATMRGATGAQPSDPLHVFGASHFAPTEMALLVAASKHRPVVLYVPDPSRHYWAGLPGDAARLRALSAMPPFEDESEARFLEEVGHPLLARWGRMGQHFMLALHAIGDDVLADVRHWQDELEAAADQPLPLLQRVQTSIRQLDANLVSALPATPALSDASLRVHLCHTRLRELEVLRDALLDARAADSSLKPSDMVVMAPAIGAYVPLLGSVFGAPGEAGAPLPYHLADVAVVRTHPLLTAFAQLLTLPQSRITAPEVVDLLKIPQIALALGLSEADVDTVSLWLQRAGVAWGLDARFREHFNVPALTEHSFAWGMDRMLAGYVFGQAEPGRAIELPNGPASTSRVLPMEGVHGAHAPLLGALDRLLQQLARFHRDTAGLRPASAWSARLLALVDSLFRIDHDDRDAREALALLRRMVESLALETKDASDPQLAFTVVREVMLGQLAAVSERQSFLLGGITFCGMVPQRAIPFRLVAVLGLNESEFPRQPSDAGLDLMRRHRRLGDRDVRCDDRYLFLETLMSARERLHLSYVGEGVRDGTARNPAAPLADLLEFLDQSAAVGVSAALDDENAAKAEEGGDALPQTARPWRVKHPLQPFDARYFNRRDPRLYSFDASLAEVDGANEPVAPFLARKRATPMPIGRARAAAATEVTVRVPLRGIVGWFKDPARHALSSVLQLRLDALEESRLMADEPLDPKLEAIDRTARRLVLDALLRIGPNGTSIDARAPDWLALSGKLPPGKLGEYAWNTERDKALDVLRSNPIALTAGQSLRRVPRSVRHPSRDVLVEGELQDVVTHDGGNTLWWLEAQTKSENELDFKVRVPFFLQWALLRLSSPDEIEVRACLLVCDKGKNPRREWRDALDAWCTKFRAADQLGRAALRDELRRRVDIVVGEYCSATQETAWYMPKSSWAALALDTDATAVEATWKQERAYAPGYARLLGRGVAFEAGSVELEALRQTAQRLVRAIGLDAAVDA